MTMSPRRLWIGALSLVASRGKGATADVPAPTPAPARPYFRRAATFPVCLQDHPTCDADAVASAASVAFLPHGVLAYADPARGRLGFVDVADPAAPVADGVVDLGGAPTGLGVLGLAGDEGPGLVAVGVDTSESDAAPSGHIEVVDTYNRALLPPEYLGDLSLGGRPGSVATSNFAWGGDFPWWIAVAVEGAAPADKVSVVKFEYQSVTLFDVDLTGMEGCLSPGDPKPKQVKIDAYSNTVGVTLPANNCVAVIDLAPLDLGDPRVYGSWSSGVVDLSSVDLTEDGVINQTEAAVGRMREPEGLSFFFPGQILHTNGGSRSWSMVDTFGVPGRISYDSENKMDLDAVQIGHYPEARSGDDGNQPGDILFIPPAAAFEGRPLILVASKGASVVFVHELIVAPPPPVLQALPVGLGPTGLAFDAGTSVLAVASAEDGRGDKVRSSITLFTVEAAAAPDYPSLVAGPRMGNGADGPFVPFSALSGLAAAAPLGAAALAGMPAHVLYAVEDSFYQRSRVLTIDASTFPALIMAESRITDPDGVLATCLEGKLGADVSLADLVNADGTVNLDPEGIAVAAAGGFWVVSEGRGTIDDVAKPFEYPNLLLRLTQEAVITACVTPDDSFPPQLRFGFEGVAEDGDHVAVAMQRAWGDEAHPRIAVYNVASGLWKHAFFPLDAPRSQNSGWVGLSDIAPVGPGRFYVLERDNQGGPDAAIKSIASINLGDYSFADGTVLTKKRHRDLIPDLLSTNGMTYEKVEGLAVTKCGKVWVNNDNDGVDGNSGEQVLLQVSTVAHSCQENYDGKNKCIDDDDCANARKCAKNPDKCKCRDVQCRRKKRDCATRGQEAEWWGCGDGEECIAGVKQNGKTYKWGKCASGQ